VPKISANSLVEKPILDWIDERASIHPDATALLDISGSYQISFLELAEQISTLTQQFREFGVGRDTKVAVSLKDGPETLAILLSLMSIASVLPIHPTAPVATFDALVEQVGVSIVVSGSRPASAAWKTAQARGLCYVEVGSETLRSGLIQLTPHRVMTAPSDEKSGLDDVALYIPTSGTTGKSSIVAITQRSLDRNIATHGILNGYGPQTRAICVMNFNYLFAYVRASLPVLRFGGSVAVAPGYRFSDLKACCEAIRPTCMAATPMILQKFITDAEDKCWRPEPGVLDRFHATGEAIPNSLRTRLRDVFNASLGTNYGMTEVSPQVAICQPEDQFEPGVAGKIVPPWEVDIIADDGTVLPIGHVGRIALRGGYVNAIVGMKEETRFDDNGLLLTGDRGFVDQSGVLFIAGRADEVINRGGEKIDPKAIEQTLERDPDVERAVAFGLPDPKFGQKVFALVVLRKGATRGAQEIRESSALQISGWGLPERFIIVSEIPTNANGKVSRRELALRYSDV
jgi:acyl-CoA synthetase (AMP-forming)/AMP-acid ligase II